MSNRYEASGHQADHQPGSNGLVLRNLLGISSADAMADLELSLLEQLYQAIFQQTFPNRILTVADLKAWHYRWLGNVYTWAGEERAVNMTKDGFPFAPAAQIPRQLKQLKIRYLDKLTPAHKLQNMALAQAMAVVHVELILIHPFREGNGRIARLLADVMAVQAGRDLLDYSAWDSDKSRYFGAIQRGLSGDYEPMTRLMEMALGG